MHKLVLASQSPRRADLLNRAGFKFESLPTQISEIPNKNLSLAEQIRGIARDKAMACLNLRNHQENQPYIALASDTEVAIEETLLGKPGSDEENIDFIRRLAGRKHRVITAICMVESGSGKEWLGHDEAEVTFFNLTENEIRDYVMTGDGRDKAGGYGIQGAGKILVKSVVGAWDTVMGLHVARVEQGLRVNNWKVERK